MSPDLYATHAGSFEITEVPTGKPDALNEAERDTADSVVKFYGDKSAQWLSDLTHRESPWRDARAEAGLHDGERGNVEITHAAMLNYYSSIAPRTA